MERKKKNDQVSLFFSNEFLHALSATNLDAIGELDATRQRR